MFVLKLVPIPKDLKYLQGFHPVLVGLFPQSLQETPEGTRENKHLLRLTPVRGFDPDPLPHWRRMTQGLVHAAMILGCGIWAGSGILGHPGPSTSTPPKELFKDWLLWRGPRPVSPLLISSESLKRNGYPAPQHGNANLPI